MSRDPIGFADGPNLYRYVSNNPTVAIDPYGTWAAKPVTKGKVCAVPLINHGGWPHPRWVEEAKNVGDCVLEKGAKSRQDILDFVKKCGCCTLFVIGHQGGDLRPPNKGGAVSYPDPMNPKDPAYIFGKDTADFEGLLNEAFADNRCDHCVINIVTCGGTTKEHRKRRKEIAKRTGCLVCGSTRTINVGGNDKTCCTLGEADTVKYPDFSDPDEITTGTRPRPRWPYECELPDNNTWKRVKAM